MKNIHKKTLAPASARPDLLGSTAVMTRIGSFGVRQMYADLKQMQTQLQALKAASDRFLSPAI